MQAPSRYRRNGPGMDTASAAHHNRMPGGSVPLKINFNSTRTPRQPPTRRRSAEYRSDYHSPVDRSIPLQRRSDESSRASPLPATKTTDQVWDLGLQRLKVRDDTSVPFSSNETLPLPPVRAEACSTPLQFPKPPKANKGVPRAPISPLYREQPPPDAWDLQRLTHGSALDRLRLAADSPLQGAFEPTFLLSPSPEPPRTTPNAKRARTPNPWVTTDYVRTQRPDPVARPYCNPPTTSGLTRTKTPGPNFQIPRKPPPVPKTAAPRPAPLKLFPATPPATASAAAAAVNLSPPGSLRSGSTLVGVDTSTEGQPVTPTTTGLMQGLLQKAVEGSPSSCSPGHATASSGWYDEEEGNERAGLMTPRKRGRSFRGFGRVWRGCFSCS